MATVTETPATTSPRRAVDYWIFLGVAIVASIIVRLIVNTKFQAPTILTDELTYSQLARDIADGKFSLNNGYGVVYPLLLAPSWVFNQFGTEAYTWMKATNAVLVSLTAIPVFFWAKRMMQPRYALLAAILTLAMPSMAYSGHVMTENAFLLFFMLAAWAIAVAVERPTIFNQVLVVLAVAVAFGTRAQAVALLAALPLIIVLHVLAEERASGAFSLRGCGRRLLRFWPLAAIAGLGVVAVLVRTLTTDWQVSQLLQAYSATTAGQYTVENVSRYFLWHLGEATFALGVIPVAALLLLVGLGILNRTRSTAERAYLCTALVVSPLVILQVAVFTSYWSQRVSERNMFCVFPIVLIGLALWFDQWFPRIRRTTALAAAIAGSLVMCVPFGYLYPRVPVTETWALVLPEILSRKLAQGGYDVQVLIVGGTAIALLIFGILRRGAAVAVVPIVLIAFFAVTEASAVHSIEKSSSSYRAAVGTGANAAWIDQQLGRDSDAALLLGSSAGPDADRDYLWQTQFFNQRQFSTARWGTELMADPFTGTVTNAAGEPATLPSIVVTPVSQQVAGTVIARNGMFMMVRPDTPATLASMSSGFIAAGWTAPQAAMTWFASTNASTLRVHLDRAGISANAPAATATVTVGPLVADADGAPTPAPDSPVQTGAISSTTSADFDFAVPTTPFRITISIDPPYRPSDFGQSDTRELGARAIITLGDQVIAG